MKSSITLGGLVFALFVTSLVPVEARAAEKSARPAAAELAKEQNAKLAELKKQQAANDAAIKQLQAKLKPRAEKKAQRVSQTKLKAQPDQVKDQKDSLSEMGSEDQLKMQQLMDKKAQLEEMISNVMKKSSETANNITDNLK